MSPAQRPASLRTRLLLLGLMVLVVALGLVGLALDAAFARSAETELRNQMETWVYLVLGAAEIDEQGGLRIEDETGDPRLAQPGSGIFVNVRGSLGRWNSPSALGVDAPALPPVAAGQQRFVQPGTANPFYALQFGVGWEVDDGEVLPITVTVWVEPRLLAAKTRAFQQGLWRSLGAAGLILGLAQFVFLWMALRPFRQVAGDVAEIEAGARERLDGPYPRELEPLTRNLDRLLATEKANQERYRSALDSLAHSLKTPLAVIRAGLPKSQGPEVPAMQEAVDEMQQLIVSRLQRAAASTRRTHAAPVAVLPIVQRLIASLRKVYSQDLKTVSVTVPPELVFHVELRDLMELFGNLLDNACKYGAGAVAVSAGHEAGAAWLQVENDGRPIPVEQAQRLVQRGVRGDERERIEGHGLGLTIVTELVSAYGGELHIGESELGGAAITVRLPDQGQ